MYVKFKNRQNLNMAIETRPWFPMGDWKEAQGSFWDDGNVLYLNQGSCLHRWIHFPKFIKLYP